MDTRTENKYLLNRNSNQRVIDFNSLSLIANSENVISGARLDFLYGSIEARGLQHTKADAITGYEQNTTQVELGAGKWGALFMSPTIVILMTSRTKGRLSLNSETREDGSFTDLLRGHRQRLSARTKKRPQFPSP